MEIFTFVGILLGLTLQCKANARLFQRDQYRDRIYYKICLHLTEIPSDIPAEALRVYLDENKITVITVIRANIFSHLSQCTGLELIYNEISEVEPGAFNGLSTLTELVLQRNRLEGLYKNMFSGLLSCTRLNIRKNQISEIEPGSFNGLGNLKQLDLEVNHLATLKVGMFEGLMSASWLDLTANSISYIQDNTFANMKNLNTLWLDGNKLETLCPGMFFGLNSLKELTLRRNDLTILQADVFQHLPRPLELAMRKHNNDPLTANPLQCDSDLCWVKQEELNGTITWYTLGGNIHKPRCANGKDWDSWTCVERGTPSSSSMCLMSTTPEATTETSIGSTTTIETSATTTETSDATTTADTTRSETSTATTVHETTVMAATTSTTIPVITETSNVTTTGDTTRSETAASNIIDETTVMAATTATTGDTRGAKIIKGRNNVELKWNFVAVGAALLTITIIAAIIVIFVKRRGIVCWGHIPKSTTGRNLASDLENTKGLNGKTGEGSSFWDPQSHQVPMRRKDRMF